MQNARLNTFAPLKAPAVKSGEQTNWRLEGEFKRESRVTRSSRLLAFTAAAALIAARLTSSYLALISAL